MRGTVLDDRYELVQWLGHGGMGEVWGARDTRMDRDVAVKLLKWPPGADGHAAFVRFRREIRSAAQLPGRHTVIAHDCGETVLDGRRVPYLVMERLTGHTLQQAVVERRPSWQRAVEWGCQVLAALEAAHAQGIVHRDIKPNNVMFTADGELKVLDFGIAKFMDGTIGLTATGTGIGSIGYMSPEQCRGTRTLDHRADLYSFGCLLYFMLTGRPPIVADSAFSYAHLLMHGEVDPPHAVEAGVPGALSDLVMRLLARRPEERPGSAREVRDRLGALLAGHEAHSRPDVARLRTEAEAEADALRRAALQDAHVMREETRRAARRHRELVEAAAQQVRDDVEAYAAQRKADAEADARRIVDEAWRRKAQVLTGLDHLREKVAAVLADSKYLPVGELVEQRAALLAELTALHASLADASGASRIPNARL
ncbi:protein kinase [Streptomyces sp. NPDC013455]|uniref:serine/threonine-protein kinase n=1 Tax=Streptomyces sp. NPDC013455 TaxID=3155605 RepID=UPI0033FCE144